MNRVKEEKKKRRYVNTPSGRVDLHGGTTLSREDWIEVTNRADPLENSLRKTKQFEASEPRKRALKLLRSGRQHYLLNRAGVAVRRLRYRTQLTSDFGEAEGPARTFEVVDVVPKSFVGVGPVPREAQRKRLVLLVHVEWADGYAMDGEMPVRLRQWAPHNGGTRAPNLNLRYVPRLPRRVSSGE